MWLLWCGGGATVDYFREDELRIAVGLWRRFRFGREPQSYLLIGRALLVGSS